MKTTLTVLTATTGPQTKGMVVLLVYVAGVIRNCNGTAAITSVLKMCPASLATKPWYFRPVTTISAAALSALAK